jgi:hypothetical protein
LALKGLHQGWQHKTDARQRAWCYFEEIESAILVVEGVVASASEVKRTSGHGSIAIRTAIAAASHGKTVGR